MPSVIRKLSATIGEGAVDDCQSVGANYSLFDGGGWSKMKVSFSVSSQSILKRFL